MAGRRINQPLALPGQRRPRSEADRVGQIRVERNHFLARKHFQFRPEHVLTIVKNLANHSAIQTVREYVRAARATVW